MMIQENDLVFDVGAYVGDKTESYLRKGARVVCFEPEPVSLDKLHKRFDGNLNVTIVPQGLSSFSGMQRLEICTAARTISTFASHWQTGRFRKYHWDHHFDVPVTTLDAAIALYGLPRFIKIDVEGYELEVLRGLSQQVPYLSFEFAREFLSHTVMCLGRLMDLGYCDFNVTLEKDPEFAGEWTAWDALVLWLTNQDEKAWGDVFCRE